MQFKIKSERLPRIIQCEDCFTKHWIRVYRDKMFLGRALLIEADLAQIKRYNEVFAYIADTYEMDYGATIESLFDEENACTVGESTDTVWYLELLKVQPEYIGKRVGEAILDRLITEMKISGLLCLYSYPVGNVFLSKAHADNAKRKVSESYRRMGFTPHKTTPQVMWKSIPACTT